MTKQLVIPCISLNESGKANLIEERCKAAYAINNAILSLIEMYPAPSDYLLSNGHFKIACENHEWRINSLREIYKELQAEVAELDKEYMEIRAIIELE